MTETLKPRIIYLCGSARFADEFMRQYQRLTEAGNIVLLPCMPMRVRLEQSEPSLKTRLDDLHKRKIELADDVLVLNIGGYIGESTAGEIGHATRLKNLWTMSRQQTDNAPRRRINEKQVPLYPVLCVFRPSQQGAGVL